MNIHVVPTNDRIVHELSEDCFCCPTPEFCEGATFWIHAAVDGRGSVETFFEELAEKMNFDSWEFWHDDYFEDSFAI